MKSKSSLNSYTCCYLSFIRFLSDLEISVPRDGTMSYNEYLEFFWRIEKDQR
jgi:hypothetical protein